MLLRNLVVWGSGLGISSSLIPFYSYYSPFFFKTEDKLSEQNEKLKKEIDKIIKLLKPDLKDKYEIIKSHVKGKFTVVTLKSKVFYEDSNQEQLNTFRVYVLNDQRKQRILNRIEKQEAYKDISRMDNILDN